MSEKERDSARGRDVRGQRWLDKAVGGPSAPGAGPLSSQVQAEMEDALGQDLGDVRVHRGSERADDLGARAFAEGSDIHFGAGEFSPATGDGRELLMHELVHVAQNQLADQGQGRPASQGDRETEARQIAQTGAGSPELQGAPRQAQYDLRGDINDIVGQTRTDKGFIILISVELASAEDVRAVLADARTMRRISAALSPSQLPLFRGAAARRLAAAGAYGEAFGLLLSSNATTQRQNLAGYGAEAQQRELEEHVIQTSEDIRLVRAAFSLYWNVRLDTTGGRLDRDGSGPRPAESVSAPWTVDRLRQIHTALRALPDADVRSGAFRRLSLEAHSTGGSFDDARGTANFGRFEIGADVSDRRVPAHFLSAAAAHGQTRLQLDAIDGLNAGHTVSVDTGASVEQATVASLDAATRVATVARALLRDHAVGARVLAQVASTAEYRTTGVQLSRDTAAGATSVVLSEPGTFAAGDVVLVGDGTNGGERRTLSAVDAATRTITFTTPLVRAHFQTDRVAPATMIEVGLSLTAAAAASATTLAVSATTSFEPGADFLIAPGTPAQEPGHVQSLDRAAATLTLATPLLHAHSIGTVLQRNAPVAGYQITTNVHQRARTLVLNDVTNLNAQTTLMIDEGGPRREIVTVASVDAAHHTVRLNADLDMDHPAGTTLAPLRGYASHVVVDATAVSATTFVSNTVVNLHAGDRVTLGRNTAHEEQVTIRSIDAATRTLTLTAGLTHAHPARTALALPDGRELSVGWLSSVVRHEIGHALDAALGASGTREFKETIGGWRESTSFEAWTAQMGDAWRTNSGAVISAAERAQVKARIVARMQVRGTQALDQGLAASHPIRRYWDEGVPVIEASKMTRFGQAFWQHPAHIREYNGFCFAINHYYNHFQYYKAEVQNHRVRDYSSFSAAEFFAEVYTVFYEEAGQTPAPEPGRLVPVPAWRDWMRTNIHNRGRTPAAATSAGHTHPSIGMAANNPGPRS